MHAVLRNDLKRVCNAVAQNAGIEHGGQGSSERLKRRRLKNEHEDKAPDAAHKKLQAAHAHAFDQWGKSINDQNMDCEGKCAGNNKAVAERELEFTLLHAQKVKSCHGQNHRRPNIEARASADEDANHGHEHDVQTRQKAGLADRCVQKPKLLQRLGNEKRRAAAKAAQPKTRIFPGACRRLLRFGCRGGGSCILILFCRPRIKQRNHRQQKKSADDRARPRKGKGAHMLHAESLGDKARSPDCRSNEKQKIVSCLKRHWFCVILDLIFAQTIDFIYFDDESRSRFGNRKNALPARF